MDPDTNLPISGIYMAVMAIGYPLPQDFADVVFNQSTSFHGNFTISEIAKVGFLWRLIVKRATTKIFTGDLADSSVEPLIHASFKTWRSLSNIKLY